MTGYVKQNGQKIVHNNLKDSFRSNPTQRQRVGTNYAKACTWYLIYENEMESSTSTFGGLAHCMCVRLLQYVIPIRIDAVQMRK